MAAVSILYMNTQYYLRCLQTISPSYLTTDVHVYGLCKFFISDLKILAKINRIWKSERIFYYFTNLNFIFHYGLLVQE